MYSYEGDLYDMLRNAECYKGIKDRNRSRYAICSRTFRTTCVRCRHWVRSPRSRRRSSTQFCTLGETLVGGDMDEGYTLKTLGPERKI